MIHDVGGDDKVYWAVHRHQPVKHEAEGRTLKIGPL